MKVESELSGADLVQRIVEALIGLDAPAVLSAVADARRQHGPAEVIGRLVLPAVDELERRKRAGKLDQAGLAASTALARRALSRAADPAVPVPDGATRRTVVVAGPQSAGGLDAEAAYETLLATGNPAQLLVTVDDADVLARHLAALGPLAVVAASAEPRTLPGIAALAATAARCGIPVLATGAAFGPGGARAHRVGAAAWVPGPVAMLETLDAWRSGGVLPVQAPEPADAALVRAAWPAVVMAAAGSGGPDERWAQSTARLLGEMLVASLWTGDVTVLLDWLDSEWTGADRSEVRDVHVVGLLDAVAAALPSTMEVPSGMLGDAREHLRQQILDPGAPRAPRPAVLDPLAAAPQPPARSGPPATPSQPTLTVVPSGPTPPPGGPAAGQAFADLLLLSALAAQAAAAAVAVVQPGGRWSALAHGLEQREGLNDPLLWSTIAGRRDPVEIADMAVHPDLARSPLAQRPVALRWMYGTALRDPQGSVIGVFCLMDRSLRQATRREQRALVAGARQLNSHLLQLRRAAAAPVAPAPLPSPWGTPRPGAERQPVTSRRGVTLPDGQQLLRSHEVAVLFDVTERTVINWAAANKLPSLRTIGGHLRFRSEDVYNLLSSRRAGA